MESQSSFDCYMSELLSPVEFCEMEGYQYSVGQASSSGYCSPDQWSTGESAYEAQPQFNRELSLGLDLNFSLKDNQVQDLEEKTGCQLAKTADGSVIVTGAPEKVETARSAIRGLAPLTYCFEMPGRYRRSNKDREQVEDKIKRILTLQQAKHLDVKLETGKEGGRRRKNFYYTTRVFIRGPESEAQLLQKLTMILICSLCASLIDIRVSLEMRIAPRLQEQIRGRHNELRRQIMHVTSTRITFFHFKVENTCSISIVGSHHGVYLAHQHFLGLLPVTIRFEIPFRPDRQFLAELEQSYNVELKQRLNKGEVVQIEIKCAEKYISSLYQVRRAIFDYDEPDVPASVPESYFISGLDFATENCIATQNPPSKILYRTNGECIVKNVDLSDVEVRPTLKFLKKNRFNIPLTYVISDKEVKVEKENENVSLVRGLIDLLQF